MPRIINVSNRLPIKIGKEITKSSGGLVSALEGVANTFDFSWVGWHGETVNKRADKRAIEEKLKDQYKYFPIFLNQKEIDEYYQGFSNASLWPLLHYMPTYSRFEESWFEAYQKVNEKFCQKILEISNKYDIVWVHDYHLFLLPSMLKKAAATLKVGFFLHTPFPSYELFRCHPRRIELVEGLLGADLIGFHTFGYLRHFRSTVLRLLGLESEVDCITHGGMISKIGVFPIGINWKNFEKAMEEKAFLKYFHEYKQLFQGKRVVLAVERLDYTKGIPHKIKAIEHFLKEHLEARDDTLFIIIAVPSRESVSEYLNLKHEVESLVGRINGQYSSIKNIPIHFINHGVKFHELCALYSLADVALVTPLMDGMNLVAKEYIACQNKKNGVLILSEFAGAAQELFNAVMVNPYDIDEVSRSIEVALEMNEEEKMQMITPMKDRIIQHDALYWAHNFINELTSADSSAKSASVIKELDETMASAIKKTPGEIAFFLDYDGTLRELVKDPLKASLTEELLEVMEHLANNPRYHVHIVSGRKMVFLKEQFKDFPFILVAEHGYTWMGEDKRCQLLNENVVTDWKKRIIEVFELYALSTPGSSIEEKNSSVVWHYRKSDPEFGEWKAGELLGELTEVISNLPVEIHRGKKIVEVSSQQVSKGRAVEIMLAKKDYALCLCAGDDQTDETMFRIDHPRHIGVKVGKGSTQAEYHVPSPVQFRQFLKKL